MLNGKLLNSQKGQLDEAAQDFDTVKQALEALIEKQTFSNSLEHEILEFFKEIAVLKNKNVQEVLLETVQGIESYFEGIDAQVNFRFGIPTDIEAYSIKNRKIAQGIEFCWDLFSEEGHSYFISIANGFLKAYSAVKRWQKLLLRLNLLVPSILKRKNLFKEYIEASLAIPNAVAKAVELRESKSTIQLKATSKSLKAHIKALRTQSEEMISSLKRLGIDREDQLRKNQDAMKWAKARLQEMENKRKG